MGLWTRVNVVFGAVLLAAYAALVARMRPIVWKLADETFCLADWDGFREAALPGMYPGGALKWLSSLLMTTGLRDAVWWLPYFALPFLPSLVFAIRARRFRVFASPFLLTFVALLLAETRIWQLPDYAFPMTNLLGMVLMVGLVAGFRRMPLRGVVVCAAFYVPCGLYALLAGGSLVVCDLVDGSSRGRMYRWGLRAAALVLLAVTPWCVATCVYDDVAVGLSFGYSQSILNGALLEPLGAWSVGVFLLYGLEIAWWPRCGGQSVVSWRSRLAVWMGVGLLGIAVSTCARDVDLRAQLKMERYMLEGRFADALEVHAADPMPLRMSLAYRVVALWRTGRLETELFARPFTSFHRTSSAEELKMGGEWLLFAYGLLQPARQQTMELVAARGWQPEFLRLMGDAAFLTGETALAVRDWGQLARCPFRGAFARHRLEAVQAGKGLDDPAFADLRAAAMMYAVMDETVQARPEPPFYYLNDQNAEAFAYGRLLTIKGTPPPEAARLILAAYLLEKDAKALLASRGMMDALCVEGPWPRLWQQGALAALGRLPEGERAGVIGSLRAGVFEVAEAERFDAFVLDAQGSPTNGVDLAARYGDTYYHYDACVQ